MTQTGQKFLESVLGADGLGALNRVAERSSRFAHALIPRTVLSWLKQIDSHDGEIPGVTDSYICFSKSEAGFDGAITIGDQLVPFTGVSIFHLAASMSVALDADQVTGGSDIRDIDLERLGKSIDLLVSGKKSKEKADPDDDLSDEDYHKKHGCSRLEKQAMSGPGKPAASIAPTPPAPPTASAPVPKTTPVSPAKVLASAKPPSIKPPTTKLSLSEASHKCAVCGVPQFAGKIFTGCMCLRGLSKSIIVISSDEAGHVIELAPKADRSLFATLLEAVGRD